MDPHPLVGNGLPSFGGDEQGVLPYPEHRATLDCDDRARCAERLLKGKSTYASSIRLLSCTFISLAVVYLLLRCFDLMGGRSRAALLTRSLAAGGGRKCRGGGVNDDDEEGPDEDFWIGDLEGTAGEKPSEDPSGLSMWQEGDARRWPSVRGAAAPAGSRGIRGSTSEGEHAAATAWAGRFAPNVQPQSYSGSRRVPLQYPLSQGTLHPDTGGLEGGDSGQMDVEVRLFPGESLDMWNDRNVPEYARRRLSGLFSRMVGAASSCRSLLRRLTESERLRLSFQVMRLLTLELGAISLLPESLEYLRSSLGGAILQLGFEALRSSGTQPTVEVHRVQVREVISLVLHLKNPRPRTEKGDALRYRKKMTSILQTGTPAIEYCVGVMEVLLEVEEGLAVPASLLERQIYVLQTVYDVHSSHVAMDASLRHFIVDCQNRTKIYAILGLHHLNIHTKLLPPLKDMVTSIHENVKRAGGRLPATAPSVTKHGAPGAVRDSAAPGAAESRTPQHHMAGVQSLPASASSSHLPQTMLQQFSLSRPAPHSHPPQPFLPPFPHRGSIPLASRGHHESHSIHSTSPQVTAKTITAEETMLQVPALASKRDSGSSTSFPELPWAAWQGPAHGPQPYRQPSRSAFLGASANAEVRGYPRHGGYGASDQRAQPPLLPPAARPIEQPPGGAFSWDYGIASSGVSHQDEAEVEEVEGLLRELLKGGVDSEYVFGHKKLPDQ